MNVLYMRSTVMRISLLLWLFFYGPLLYAQNVRAVLDKETVFIGESVLLTIEVQGDVGGESPEVSLLTEAFDILSSQSQTQIQIINNQQTALRSWLFEIEPKAAGILELPALPIGPNLQTQPLRLTVLPPSQQQDLSKDIFIEINAEPRDPYVQEQVRYRERIFLAVPFEGGPRREGAFSDVLLQPLGEQRRYVETRDGRNYQVFETNYALIPEKSGPLTLPRLVLRGRISNRQAGQLSLNRGRRVQIQGEELVLQVRPRPAEFSENADSNINSNTNSTWLPSWELTLSEQWNPSPPVFRVGDPVTRTVLLQAKGLDAGQLPSLELPAIDGVKLYPDQPQSSTSSDAEWLLGRREQKIAFVPTQAGELTLPEITLAWWNTQLDQAQTAILPARTVTVLPAIGAGTASTTAETPSTPSEVTSRLSEPPPQTQQDSAPFLSDQRIWQSISLALLLVWLGTVLAWWKERRHHSTSAAKPSETAQKPNQRRLRHALQRACQNHDAPAAAHSLLQWAALQWPQHPPSSLGALAARCPSLRQAVLELDRVLYSGRAGSNSAWRGTDLWRVVQTGPGPAKNAARPRQDSNDGLAVLYPQKS